MDKKEFLSKLKKEIKDLPEEEQKRVLSYYEEYLEEASKKEIEELESPEAIADKLIKEYGRKKEQKKESENRLPLYIILGIFASPFLFAFGCILFSILICIWAVIFAFGLTAFVFGIVAMILFLFSLFLIPTSFSTTLFVCGTSLLCAAISMLLCKFTWFISSKLVEGVSIIIKKVGKRGEQK